MIYLALSAYVVVLVGANMLVAVFGPPITPVLAFFLIGFDLSLRDWLHLKIRPVQMCGLILFAGALTYALNPAAGMIAVASSVAFTAAALVDWATFTRLRGSWVFRANGSNVAGAAVDSLIFPTLAFGALMPHIVLLQFVAKVAGGAIWAALLARTVQREADAF
jgi:queuosine precursor transporter